MPQQRGLLGSHVAPPPHTPEQTLGLAPTAEHGAILGFETQPLVSTDYVNDVRSSVVDAASTMVVGGSMVKIYAWCDSTVKVAVLARPSLVIGGS